MTIIVFLIDTSASMNQRVFLGGRPTLLDVAKSAVETFVKVRQRSIDSRQDRYMLLTFEEPPTNIKAGWKENLATFMSELKNLQSNGLTTLGNALRHTFDVLNVNRMQHGIDTYGQGKCPFYLEPSIIVCITDGGQLSSNSGVQEELKMHGSSPGSELTREPFRWDQRLFSLVLRMTGQPSGDREIGLVPSDNSAIDVMCEVTGGRSYAITTHRMLHQCIDSLVQKVQAGVVIQFEKHGPDPPTIDGIKTDNDEFLVIDEKNGNKISWHSSRRMIYVPRSNQKGFAGGFWPIPESYWPDQSLPTLPSRTAHPSVKFMCQPAEPMVVENFPFDKYELEPSPLTQFIIGRKQPGVCWQVYIQNSSRNSPIGFPFGYLKASTNLACVNLFVMPYNYPVLLPLVDELFRIHRCKPTGEWRAQFAMYVSSMPPYYAGPLKRALLRMGGGNIAQIIPEENYLSYSVLNYLKKLKAQAKTEYDRTCNEVALKVKASETKRVVTSFKNPFDIPRHQLLDQVARLRTLFLRPSKTSQMQHESIHSQPVGQMGNYQEYLKRMPHPLRELESAPVRQHMFGNPFKIDKRMIIDEADIDLIGNGGTKPTKKEAASTPPTPQVTQTPSATPIARGQGGTGGKRKVGPLPKDFRFTPYKSRRTSLRRGSRDEDSDSSSSGLLTPPPTPTALPVIDFDKENSIGMNSLDSSSSYHTRDVKVFGSDNNLMIDESPQDEDDDDDISPFGGSIFNNLNDINNDVDLDEDEEDEPMPSSNDRYPPNEMNGSLNDNDFSSSSNHDISRSSIPVASPSKMIPEKNGVSSTPTPHHKPPPSVIVTPSSMLNHQVNHAKVTKVNHFTTTPATNHVGNNIKVIKKVKQPRSTSKRDKLPQPSNNNCELDDDTTFKKNLDLRINLHKEIRRPVLRLDHFLSQLSHVSGSYMTKQQFIKCLAREALRFKRRKLAKALDQQAEILAPFCRPTPS